MAKYLINKKMSKAEQKRAIINAIDSAYTYKLDVWSELIFITKDYFVFSEDGEIVKLLYAIPNSNAESEMVMSFNRKYNYITDIADTIYSYILKIKHC